MSSLFTLGSKPFRKGLVWALLVALLLTSAGARAWIQYHSNRIEPADLEVPYRFGGGTLMICGGGRMPDEVVNTFVQIAGGNRARLVVIPAYRADGDDIAQLQDWWRRRGLARVTVLQAKSREESNSPAFSQSLDDATAVWLTGGDQAIFSAMYADTSVETKIRDVIARGGIVGGSSAGAAVMSKRMIAQGRDVAVESAGFDLLPNAIVDQHFLRRNRLQRMHSLLEKYPGVTGFGVDEGTALVVKLDGEKVIVIGDSYVCVVTPAHEQDDSRFAILKRGDECTLDGLRTGKQLVTSRLLLDELMDWE